MIIWFDNQRNFERDLSPCLRFSNGQWYGAHKTTLS